MDCASLVQFGKLICALLPSLLFILLDPRNFLVVGPRNECQCHNHITHHCVICIYFWVPEWHLREEEYHLPGKIGNHCPGVCQSFCRKDGCSRKDLKDHRSTGSCFWQSQTTRGPSNTVNTNWQGLSRDETRRFLCLTWKLQD